ncbi:unnamed protein product, partial [Symbiodinium pilosum]
MSLRTLAILLACVAQHSSGSRPSLNVNFMQERTLDANRHREASNQGHQQRFIDELNFDFGLDIGGPSELVEMLFGFFQGLMEDFGFSSGGGESAPTSGDNTQAYNKLGAKIREMTGTEE